MNPMTFEDLVSWQKARVLVRKIYELTRVNEVCRDFGVDRDYLRVLLHRAKQSFKSLYLKNMAARPPGVMAAGDP